MLDINQWLTDYQKAVTNAFEDRVLFIGLQGSYARKESTDTSDIDVVLILDSVTMADLNIYKKITDTLPHSELLCGFVSGKMELTHWCRYDLFQFYFDTINIQGSIDTIISLPTGLDARQAVLVGACNIYHCAAIITSTPWIRMQYKPSIKRLSLCFWQSTFVKRENM